MMRLLSQTQLGIPIVLKVSNDQLPRSTVEEVYTQINKDIDDALVLLVGILSQKFSFRSKSGSRFESTCCFSTTKLASSFC
jgi:hypothetical protein